MPPEVVATDLSDRAQMSSPGELQVMDVGRALGNDNE